jgi:hypothetical protein
LRRFKVINQKVISFKWLLVSNLGVFLEGLEVLS